MFRDGPTACTKKHRHNYICTRYFVGKIYLFPHPHPRTAVAFHLLHLSLAPLRNIARPGPPKAFPPAANPTPSNRALAAAGGVRGEGVGGSWSVTKQACIRSFLESIGRARTTVEAEGARRFLSPTDLRPPQTFGCTHSTHSLTRAMPFFFFCFVHFHCFLLSKTNTWYTFSIVQSTVCALPHHWALPCYHAH